MHIRRKNGGVSLGAYMVYLSLNNRVLI